MKRLALAQGELAQFHDADFPVRYIASIELRPGLPRGNHYHRVKREFIYLVQGEIVLRLEDVATRESWEFRLRAGDLAFVDAEIAHVLEPVMAGLGIEFSEEAFDAADTVRHEVRQGKTAASKLALPG